MNMESITIEDCLDMHYRKGKETIINDGKIIGFQEEIPTQTANQGGDNK